MKVKLTVEQMRRLLASGVIHPSEIECMDIETRNELKALCLKLCKPKQCQNCSMQTLCQSEHSHHTISMSNSVDLNHFLS